MKRYQKIFKNKFIRFVLIFMVSAIISNLIFNEDQIKSSKIEIKKITYLEFQNKVSNNDIKTINIDLSKEDFQFLDSENKIYKTTNPRYMNFKKDMLNKGIQVNEIKNDNKFINLIVNLLPSLIWIILIIYMIKKKDGLSPIKFNANESIGKSEKTFSDVAGNEEAKEDLKDIVDFLKNPQKYTLNGAKLPKGALLYGPPGTGKTLIAKAIAGEADVPFFSTSGSDFVEMYVGAGAKKIRSLFKEAQKKSPCVIFIDEIDSVGSKRNSIGNNSERDQTINALLKEMDGFDEKSGIIVIGATNRIELLDEALIRPGRFDRHIPILLPDKNARIQILKTHCKNKKLDSNINLEDIANITTGFSGATLENIMNEAAINATKNNRNQILLEDIDYAHYKAIMKGHEKKDKTGISEHERIVVAWHEAGHAIATKLLTDQSVPKVTIIPSTSGAGGITFITPPDVSLYSKENLINNIKIAYAGRVGEYLYLNSDDKITTGASNDIKQATNILKNIIKTYGMTEKYGMLSLSVLEIDDKTIINEAINLSTLYYDDIFSLLAKNKTLLKELVDLLLENETVYEDVLDELILINSSKIA